MPMPSTNLGFEQTPDFTSPAITSRKSAVAPSTSQAYLPCANKKIHKLEVRRRRGRKFWQRFPRNGGKARRTKARITKTNTPLGRGEGIDGPCANGMPANGTRNASSSSPRNPSSERIRHISQRDNRTHGGHLQTRISPAHCHLLD